MAKCLNMARISECYSAQCSPPVQAAGCVQQEAEMSAAVHLIICTAGTKAFSGLWEDEKMCGKAELSLTLQINVIRKRQKGDNVKLLQDRVFCTFTSVLSLIPWTVSFFLCLVSDEEDTAALQSYCSQDSTTKWE